ncbi:MAG: MFS transporter [Actinomycetota bacterium]
MSGIGDTLRESRDAVREVFKNRNLRRINLAFTGSIVGDGAQAVAAAVYAYLHGGATTVGILGVVRFVCMATAAPFTSLLGDRFDRKRVMIAADLLRMCIVVSAGIVIAAGGPPIAVYTMSVCAAIVSTAFRPSQAALMPSLANHPGELTAANVVSSTIESVGFFVGPAIGAFLLSVANIQTAYFFNATSFLWSAILVMGLPSQRALAAARAGTDGDEVPTSNETESPVAQETEKVSFVHQVTAGYREILRDKNLRLLVGLYCAQTVVAGASLVYEVAIALDLLKAGEGGLGLLGTAMGAGGLVGGFVALMLARRNRLAFDFGIGVMLWAAPLLLVAAWPTMAAALTAMALIGIANSLVDVNAFTILQRLAPDEVLGRVFGALESAIIGGMAVGALLMPLLINTIGLRGGLVVIGVGVTALVATGVAGLNRIDKVALAPVGLDLLRGVPMLGVLPEKVLDRLARQSASVSRAAGETVFREGDPGDRYYVIESGSVDVTIGDDLVRTLTAGEAFGEIALLRDVPRTATVTATSDLTTRAIDRDAFLAAVTGHGEAFDAADQVAERLLSVG